MSKIDIINESDVEVDVTSWEAIFEMMIKEGLFQKGDHICLKIVNDSEMRAMNSKYRGLRMTTDVLTFASDCEETAFKGDILINTDAAEMQKGDRTIEEELTVLFIHGLLHLAKMDHLSKKDKEKMDFYEEKYRKKFGI